MPRKTSRASRASSGQHTAAGESPAAFAASAIDAALKQPIMDEWQATALQDTLADQGFTNLAVVYFPARHVVRATKNGVTYLIGNPLGLLALRRKPR